MDPSTLRTHITWHREYRPEWDLTPDEYAEQGIVQWGKSRRLGLFRQGPIKAYLGVQHVDPTRPGWAILDAPSARFFISLFVSGRVVTLRTFPTMPEALTFLATHLP